MSRQVAQDGATGSTPLNYSKSHRLQPVSIVAHMDSKHARLDLLQPLGYHVGLVQSSEVWVACTNFSISVPRGGEDDGISLFGYTGSSQALSRAGESDEAPKTTEPNYIL